MGTLGTVRRTATYGSSMLFCIENKIIFNKQENSNSIKINTSLPSLEFQQKIFREHTSEIFFS